MKSEIATHPPSPDGLKLADIPQAATPYRSGAGFAQTVRWAAERVPLSLWVGLALTISLLSAAGLAPVLAPHAPDAVLAGPRLDPPNTNHWLGTDALGRDMLSRVLHGARLALAGAVLGVGSATILGVPLGMLAGYHGGRLDHLLSRLVEIWLGLPPLLLATIFVARTGPSFINALLALGLVSAPSFYRVARSRVLSIREQGYIRAARLLGASDAHIIARHLLPNSVPSILVLITTRVGRFILAGGALTFVGLGAQPPQPEWGGLLAEGRHYITAAPWLAIYPGVALTLTVLGLNMLGEGLRDLVDGQSQQR